MGSPFEAALNAFDWRAIALAAASLSVLGSVALIMLSRLLDLKNLEQTAKTEFVYASSTVFIVIFALLLLQTSEGMMMDVAKNLYCDTLCVGADMCKNMRLVEVTTLIDYVKLYMAGPIGCARKAMASLYYLSIPVEAIASIYLEIFMSEHASGFGVKWLAERITNTTQVLTFYTFMYYLIMHLLDFIKYYAGLFFAAGVALRAFPPTRGAGAYMMAISLGLYFVFPVSYILVVSVSLPQVQPEFECGKLLSDGTFTTACMLPEIPKIANSCGTQKASSVFKMKTYLEQNRDSMFSFFNVYVFQLVRHVSSAICLFPLVSMTIVLTFVLNTTNLFGGNIPEIGRGLVKLI